MAGFLEKKSFKNAIYQMFNISATLNIYFKLIHSVAWCL